MLQFELDWCEGILQAKCIITILLATASTNAWVLWVTYKQELHRSIFLCFEKRESGQTHKAGSNNWFGIASSIANATFHILLIWEERLICGCG